MKRERTRFEGTLQLCVSTLQPFEGTSQLRVSTSQPFEGTSQLRVSTSQLALLGRVTRSCVLPKG